MDKQTKSILLIVAVVIALKYTELDNKFVEMIKGTSG